MLKDIRSLFDLTRACEAVRQAGIERWAASCHEAGHAVAAIAMGWQAYGVSLDRGDREFGGACSYEIPPDGHERLAILAAGEVAEADCLRGLPYNVKVPAYARMKAAIRGDHEQAQDVLQSIGEDRPAASSPAYRAAMASARQAVAEHRVTVQVFAVALGRRLALDSRQIMTLWNLAKGLC